jgi:hypothetical protein
MDDDSADDDDENSETEKSESEMSGTENSDSEELSENDEDDDDDLSDEPVQQQSVVTKRTRKSISPPPPSPPKRRISVKDRLGKRRASPVSQVEVVPTHHSRDTGRRNNVERRRPEKRSPSVSTHRDADVASRKSRQRPASPDAKLRGRETKAQRSRTTAASSRYRLYLHYFEKQFKDFIFIFYRITQKSETLALC